MTIGKAPGLNAIPADAFKSGGPSLIRKLPDMFQSHWKNKTLPQELKMLLLCTSTREKATSGHVTTTERFSFC